MNGRLIFRPSGSVSFKASVYSELSSFIDTPSPNSLSLILPIFTNSVFLISRHKNAIETIKPGVSVSKVYDAGVQGVREAGHPRFWRQHIGHGIGLEIHETPSLADGKDLIEAGMVLAVEIPYYIIGVGGFRVEDILLVESDGCRLLSTIDREAIFSVG